MDKSSWSNAAALAIIGGSLWLFTALQREPASNSGVVGEAEPAAAGPEPAEQEQPPGAGPARGAAPLPPLAQSDAPLARALREVFGAELEPLLLPRNLVRNIVATIDSLERGAVALRLRPLVHVPGSLGLETAHRATVLSPRNYERYAPYVALLQVTDAQRIADVYLRHYRLFERAYQELGYPGRSFNARLVAVIDHLLQAPEPPGVVALVRPKVLYEYADPVLEAGSSGQKILVRIGPRNAAIVKAKLREIRAALAARGVH